MKKENEHSNGSLIDDIGIMFQPIIKMVTRVHKDGTVEKGSMGTRRFCFLGRRQ